MRKVLIIEDEELTSSLLRRIMEQEGFECSCARTASQAEKLTIEGNFDLIICDLILPDRPGIDFIRNLRKKGDEIPVIVVTGVEDIEVARNAIKDGIYGYIIKPFTRAQLLVTVENAFRRKELEDEKRKNTQRFEQEVKKRTRELEEAQQSLIQKHLELRELFGKVERAKKEWEASFDRVEEMLILVDYEGNVLRCNNGFRKYLGKGFNEIIGRSIDALLNEKNMISMPYEGNSVQIHDPESNRWFIKRIYPFDLVRGGGNIKGTLITLTDTTKLNQISQELERSNNELKEHRMRLEKAVNEIYNLIHEVILRKDFSVRYQNTHLVKCYERKKCTKTECSCYGKPPLRCWLVKGAFCSDNIQKEDCKVMYCPDCEVFNGACEDIYDQLGEQFNIMMHILEIKNRELKNYIERLKETQSQIIHQEKMASIGQLSAGIAHEINNPTGFVMSNLRTLGDYLNDVVKLINSYKKFVEDLNTMSNEHERMKAVSRINEFEREIDIEFIMEDIPSLIDESIEGTKRIKRIVSDLKNFAHPGKKELVYTDINQNIESTLNIVWNELKYKAEVKKEYGDIPQILCYPQELNQVFMNILVNAAQAIEEKGVITIRTGINDGYVEVMIADTGKGIPEEDLPRIFDPFFTTKDVGKGTGLGLNVAYNIIKKHRGAIDVKSKVGEGTTFIIRIPKEIKIVEDGGGSQV